MYTDLWQNHMLCICDVVYVVSQEVFTSTCKIWRNIFLTLVLIHRVHIQWCIASACRGHTSPGMLQGYTFPNLSLFFPHTHNIHLGITILYRAQRQYELEVSLCQLFWWVYRITFPHWPPFLLLWDRPIKTERELFDILRGACRAETLTLIIHSKSRKILLEQRITPITSCLLFAIVVFTAV